MTPQELHTFVQAAPLGMLYVLNCTREHSDDEFIEGGHTFRVIAEREGTGNLGDNTEVYYFADYGHELPTRVYPEDFDLHESGRIDLCDSCTDSYEIVAVIPPLTK